MEEVFYKKVGRKYVPFKYYDSEVMDSFPKGAHLVVVNNCGRSTRYNVDPNYAGLIAAASIAEDSLSRAIMDATEIRRQSKNFKTPLTPEQKEAWEHLVEVFGPDAKQLEWPSARECAEKAVQSLVDEAEKLLTVPSVKMAYDHFKLVAELTKDDK
jgi:hypothetical protein